MRKPPTFPRAVDIRAAAARRLLKKLRPREMEVVSMRARNWDRKEIGQRLGIGTRTVDTYCDRAARKLRANGLQWIGQRDLMVLFLQAGVIGIEDLKFRNDNVTP